MPKWLLLPGRLLAAGALHAAVIRGVVVENQTGRPLARALVTVQPVAGTAGAPLSVRTNVYGAFEFPPLAAGAYLVTASRRAFATLQYGQKRWKSAGVPVVLDEAGTATLSLRLPRFGAIAGTVVDENDVGLPEHEVMAYRNTRPPQLVTHAITDDRGMYRLWGLEPGTYLVRTAPKKGDEDSYLPTFARETARVEEARPIEVELDRQTDDVNVRPFPGRLSSVAGQALSSPQVPVTVTLVSDMGSQTTLSDTSGNFHFDSIGPGLYELYAQAAVRSARGGSCRPPFCRWSWIASAPKRTCAWAPSPTSRSWWKTLQGRPVDFTSFQVDGAPQRSLGRWPARNPAPQSRARVPSARPLGSRPRSYSRVTMLPSSL